MTFNEFQNVLKDAFDILDEDNEPYPLVMKKKNKLKKEKKND